MKVEFVLDSDLFSSNFGQIRSDAPWGEQAGCDAGDAPLVFETRYLKEARVLVQNNLVRKYKFTYDITPPPNFVEDPNNQACETGAIKLTRLELIGSNGTSTLWRRDFSYEDLCIHPYGYTHMLPAGITWPYLSTASNGFGGTTTYSYLDTHPKFTDPQMWSRNLVQQLSHNPGVGASQTKTIAYDSDSGPKFAKILVWDSGCSCFVQKYEQNPYCGFGHVTVTNADSTKEEYFFHTVLDVYLDDHRTGRPYDIYFKTAGGTTIRRIQHTWTASDTGVPTVKFVRLDETIDTLGSVPRKTTYAYDAYGNVSQKLEYGDGTDWYRKTVTTYAYNTTANIVNKAKTVTVYAQPDTVKAHSRYVYDNNASHEDAPIKGDLTRVERQKDSAGTIITWQTFTYDSYGNQLTAKDANNNGITVVYDTTLHVYPTSVTNALNQTTSYTWDTVLGKPLSKTDPNNVEANYRYDVFGRLEKLWDSIDSQTLPTVSIEYSWDDTATNYTLVRRRWTAAAPTPSGRSRTWMALAAPCRCATSGTPGTRHRWWTSPTTAAA